ncbi:unnamed protein product [Ectocarpus sp. 6 AP-2014]
MFSMVDRFGCVTSPGTHFESWVLGQAPRPRHPPTHSHTRTCLLPKNTNHSSPLHHITTTPTPPSRKKGNR